MTDGYGSPELPGVVVVAEQPIFDLLTSSGIGWNTQYPLATVQQMWEDLGNGRLNRNAAVVFFSDSVPDRETLPVSIATMASATTVIVTVWDPQNLPALQQAVAAAAQANGFPPNQNVHWVDATNGRGILDTARATVGHMVGWPHQYPTSVDVAISRTPSAPMAWNPQAHAPAPTVTAAPMAVRPPAAPNMAAPGQAAPRPARGLMPQMDVPIAQQPPRPGQATFAVTSSKGGSGKSTSSLMLATTIAQSSRAAGDPLRVVVVDMDTRDGQIGSLIGSFVPTALNIRAEPKWDEATILKNLIHDPKLGIDCLLAPVRPRTADDVGPDFYRHVIRTLQRTHDVVIMDTSVNYLDPLISTVCLPEASAIVFVTTMATTAVQGMARALREITEPVEQGGMGINRAKIGVLVNMAVAGVGMESDQVVQAALRVPIIGSIPMASKDVLLATNNNAMHALLQHPNLAPAYFKLAKACLPNRALAPATQQMAAGQAPAASAAVPTESQVPPPPSSDPSPQRGGLFGRRGGR